jgi:hypothetical protein
LEAQLQEKSDELESLKVFDVWQLKVDLKRAKGEAADRIKEEGLVGAVAADEDYDVESRKKLLEILQSSIIVGALQNGRILEVMAGCARNVGLLKMF